MRQRGFTLIELLTVMVIIGVMTMIGVPSFKNFIASQRVKSATTEMMSAMLIARSEAIKRNGTVTITPSSSSAWASGWTIATGATTLQTQQSLDGVTITPKDPTTLAATTAASVSFASTGRPAAKMYFEIVGSTTKRCVKVDSSGIPSSSSGACS